MIKPDLFKATHERILKAGEDAFPSAPVAIVSTTNTGNKSDTFSFDVLINMGGGLVKKAVELGQDVAGSDLVAEVLKDRMVKQAAAGAAVGAGIAMAIPFSIVGLGTGAAVGATVATWKYFTS